MLSKASRQIRPMVALRPLFYEITAYLFVFKKSVPWAVGLAGPIGLIFVAMGINAIGSVR
jgi:hypothetical protein